MRIGRHLPSVAVFSNCRFLVVILICSSGVGFGAWNVQTFSQYTQGEEMTVYQNYNDELKARVQDSEYTNLGGAQINATISLEFFAGPNLDSMGGPALTSVPVPAGQARTIGLFQDLMHMDLQLYGYDAIAEFFFVPADALNDPKHMTWTCDS